MKKITLVAALMVSLTTINAQTQQQDLSNHPEAAAIKACILDYVEGLYLMDTIRTARSAHWMLSKRGISRVKTADSTRLWNMSHTQLVNMARNFNKNGNYKSDAKKEIIIYDISPKSATAKLIAQGWFDYMQLAKLDGKWSIVNVLFE